MVKSLDPLRHSRLSIRLRLHSRGIDGVAEPLFGTGLVTPGVRIRKEPASWGRSTVQPSEDCRERGDIGLRITAIDAEGMKLHDLPTVVFVETAIPFFRFRASGVNLPFAIESGPMDCQLSR